MTLSPTNSAIAAAAKEIVGGLDAYAEAFQLDWPPNRESYTLAVSDIIARHVEPIVRAVEAERDAARREFADMEIRIARAQRGMNEALAKLAEVESDLEKLRLHTAAFPGKPDWIGEHLQKWIQSKDDRAAQSEKIAHQALDEKLAALTRAEQSEALLREALPAIDDRFCPKDLKWRITAHLAPKETT